MQLTIDKLGRMVLPKVMRDDLGLMPGSVLDAKEKGDSIILRPIRKETIVQDKGGVLVYTGEACGDLEKAIKKSRQNRINHMSI